MAPAPREARAPGHQARYLCRIRDIIPVGRWKLELPSQDLIEEIFLEIVLTVSDKDTEEEAESADSSCSTKCSREEWGRGPVSSAWARHASAASAMTPFPL